jgi:hypothetical protein
MKALIVVSLLALCLLGLMTASASAQAGGPVCLRIIEFDEIAQFFFLPTGGGQVVLTGMSVTFGDAYSGSGYVSGNEFTFSLSSGLLPGLLEGVVNLASNEGAGSATFADTGDNLPLTYSISSPPCAVQ